MASNIKKTATVTGKPSKADALRDKREAQHTGNGDSGKTAGKEGKVKKLALVPGGKKDEAVTTTGVLVAEVKVAASNVVKAKARVKGAKQAVVEQFNADKAAQTASGDAPVAIPTEGHNPMTAALIEDANARREREYAERKAASEKEPEVEASVPAVAVPAAAKKRGGKGARVAAEPAVLDAAPDAEPGDVDGAAAPAAALTERRVAKALRFLPTERRHELFMAAFSRPVPLTATTTTVCSALALVMVATPESIPVDVLARIKVRKVATERPAGEGKRPNILIVMRDALLALKPGEELRVEAFVAACSERGVDVASMQPYKTRGADRIVPFYAKILDRECFASISAPLTGRILLGKDFASVAPAASVASK